MNKLYTIINDIKIFRTQIIDSHSKHNWRAKYCVICNKPIKDGDKISLLMNNHKLFPNVWIHDSAITDKYDAKWTIEYIIYKYKKYLSHKNERDIWEI